MKEPWSYPSIVEMLLYLCSNTRPDICFAMSQVARFTHSPKQSHAIAVKRIVRYFVGTADKGTMISFPTSFGLTCYPDSDFAFSYKCDPDDSPTSAKLRSGYIIKFCQCPLLWKSKLQPSIALSTGEAEYYSLSQAMRALLPIKAILAELFSFVIVPAPFESLSQNIATMVYVDYKSALTLARDQQITSRTHHYHYRSTISSGIMLDPESITKIMVTTNREFRLNTLKPLSKMTISLPKDLLTFPLKPTGSACKGGSVIILCLVSMCGQIGNLTGESR